jgi:regulator of CtrA degradation
MLIPQDMSVPQWHGLDEGAEGMSADYGDSDIGFADAGEVTFQTFMTSDLFQRTYREGMQLVEETSAYLDGPGRLASRNLSRQASLAYAGESMRLTTRLMQVAAWLLVRKAVHEGEMTAEEAAAEKYRLAAKEIARAGRITGSQGLPEPLLDLIARSERLYARVERLDSQLRERPQMVDAAHPLADQFDRVEAFFRENLKRSFGRD